VFAGLSAHYDLVAPDLRGFGETENPVIGPNPNATVDTHAQDQHALANQLGFERFGLVSQLGDRGISARTPGRHRPLHSSSVARTLA
jgi:pimeloyl-ACP methyl ester carboxylesterase